MGEVHEGTAHMDWLEEEQERGITITSAATTFLWEDTVFNLIDTPGHVDFTAEVERSLRVLDGAVGVFCGVAGVQAQSETVWRQANRYQVPRIGFINKLDRVGSDYFRVLETIADSFGCITLPMIVPVGAEGEFRGVVDLVTMKQFSFDEESLGRIVTESMIDEDLVDLAEMWRGELLERVADGSDQVMEHIVEGTEVPVDLLRAAIRQGTLKHLWVPVLGGSAFRNKGIQPLLEAVIHYLPSPEDIAEVKGTDPKKGTELTRALTEDDPFSALLFKVQIDVHGELCFLRIYSGSIAKGDTCLNPRTRKRERMGPIFRMHANSREVLDRARAGDIVAVTGLRSSGTGDTLCSEGAPIFLEDLVFPETVISMAVEPKSAADRDKLKEHLDRLSREDPTFRLEVNEETGQFIMSGMGELHLEVIRNRLERDFKVDANIGKPRVAYRQTIQREASSRVTFERLVGGKDQFGEVEIVLSPTSAGANCEVEWIEGGSIPAPWRQSVEDTIAAALSGGGDLGFPFIQVKVGIRVPPIDPRSTEGGMAMAAREAFEGAHSKAGDVLLEPVMAFQVTTPEEYFGSVHQDLVRRRASIESVDLAVGDRILNGAVPLSEVFGYTTTLRSISQGRAEASLEPIGFAPAPDKVAERFRF